MRYIIKIIQRYDLILIQEIRDKSQTVMYKVLKQLEEAKTPYRKHISKRLGRTTSKEQYAFLYRIGSGINLEDSFTFDDGSEANKNDTFQREPFVARFSFKNLPFKYINFIAIHVEPNTAVSELQHLMDVYEETLKRWKSKDVIILGDLNADCSYVPKSKWSSIPLRSDHYYWPIGDSEDTTITKTNCAYDRFVIAGNKLIDLAKTGQVSVFKFDEFYGLNYTMARSISDHYPIELDLPIKENNEFSSSSKSTVPFKFLANRFFPIISAHWMQCNIWILFSLSKHIL
ncbi:DNASE1 [Acanthosepion pharaonis]|uniref:Deoxyribonuclease n=1 Tax=Acanthosepion pharaonis TaxID=158019 RepID=A0A812EK75_ACAPH|nr:DNASE1 [Sepia pharaonis]